MLDLAGRMDIARKYGRSSLSYITLDRRNEVLTLDGVEGYVAHRRSGKTQVGMGGPVCSGKDEKVMIEAFRSMCKENGTRPVFFGSTKSQKRTLSGLGFECIVAARDSRVDLKKFSTRGNRMLNVRRGYNHARNVGLRWEEYRPARKRDAKVERECDAISDEWLEDKGGLELEFIVGRTDWDFAGERRFFIARSDRRVEGFLTYHPVYGRNSWYLDLSRRRMDSPNGTMDYLVVESMRMFKEEGSPFCYLGMIPELNFPRQLETSGPVIKSVIKGLIDQAEFFYPASSERFFKDKYGPVWDDLYLCMDGSLSIGFIHDMIKVFQPAGVRGMMGRKVRTTRRP